MWNGPAVTRDALPSSANPAPLAFLDKKGVEWSVVCHHPPERHGRLALDFASATGKRRSSEIQAVQIEQLQALSEEAWQTLLANAAVIEME